MSSSTEERLESGRIGTVRCCLCHPTNGVQVLMFHIDDDVKLCWQIYHETATAGGFPRYCTLLWLSYSRPAHLPLWAGLQQQWAEPTSCQAPALTGTWLRTPFSFTAHAWMLTFSSRLIGRGQMQTPPTRDMTHCMTSLASRPITLTDTGISVCNWLYYLQA